jgi:hypothetical protein
MDLKKQDTEHLSMMEAKERRYFLEVTCLLLLTRMSRSSAVFKQRKNFPRLKGLSSEN